jgi:hypothetical protein
LRTVLVAPPAPPAIPNWVEDGTGLVGEYFTGTNLVTRQLVRTDAVLNWDWAAGTPASGLPADRFSVRWSSRIQPRYSEVYTFHLTTDDGCRLWINNQLLIDKWHDDPGTDTTGSILLTGGERYDLRIDFYENTGNSSAKLEWNSASQAREIVPQGVLFPNRAPVLAAVSDKSILAGRTLTVTNSASDPDVPAQTLTFNLLIAPAGASISSSSGVITWRPAIAQSSATHGFSVVVADNGTPSLTSTQTFNVTVLRPTSPTLTLPSMAGGIFQVFVAGDSGPDYSVYAATNLTGAPWSLLVTTNSPALPFLFTDPSVTNSPQRYYRVFLGP